MKKRIIALLFALCLLAYAGCAAAAGADPYDFSSRKIGAAVSVMLNIPMDEITAETLKEVTSLTLEGNSRGTLSALTNLQHVYLNDNQISDTSPLWNLKDTAQRIDLEGNPQTKIIQ